jgi:predicted phosphate transport protein (TIGR00153 family)
MGKVSPLFRRTRLIEARIDEFLDHISESGIIFRRAVKGYLQSGPAEEFDDAMLHIDDIESRADELRRTIEAELYERTLIPDLRADVLTLLEDMDNLINVCEANCYRFSIETPEIPEEFHQDFNNLTETASECIDAVVMAGRAYFRNIQAVRDHTHKVILLESEADKISTKLKRAIFAADIPKVEKIHLRYFVDRIDELPNAAEDIADQLGIFTVKRSI